MPRLNRGAGGGAPRQGGGRPRGSARRRDRRAACVSRGDVCLPTGKGQCKIALLNLQTAKGKLHEILKWAKVNEIELLLCQEMRLGPASYAATKAIAKTFGYKFIPNAAAGDNHLEGGLGVFASRLVDALQTPEEVIDHRRAQFIRVKRKGDKAIRIANIHLPLQARQAGQQLDAILAGLARFGGDRCVGGDFNLIPSETAVSKYMWSGAMNCADPEATWEQPTRKEPLGSNRKPRHVDYLLHSGGIAATAPETHDVSEKSDHLAQVYQLNAVLDGEKRKPQRHKGKKQLRRSARPTASLRCRSR